MQVQSVLSTVEPPHTDEKGNANLAEVLVIGSGLLTWLPTSRHDGACIAPLAPSPSGPSWGSTGQLQAQVVQMMENPSDGICVVGRIQCRGGWRPCKVVGCTLAAARKPLRASELL